MSTRNRERRKERRGLLRWYRRHQDSVIVSTWFTKDRMTTFLGNLADGVILEDLRVEDSPYWHGKMPYVLIDLTAPVQLE